MIPILTQEELEWSPHVRWISFEKLIMLKGLLQVRGSIDLGQFWPQGESDADTTKIIVQTGGQAFRYRATPGGRPVITRVFENAVVIGSVRKPAIDSKGRLTIRLQGLDAPELHYRPTPIPKTVLVSAAQKTRFKSVNNFYRQHFGETATVKLKAFLSAGGRSTISCTVMTAVNEPGDAFDTYGRLVGDIWVERSGKPVNINDWLVAQGWAFPAFYNSMLPTEIKRLRDLARAGRRKAERLWPHLGLTVGSFDPKLRYRGKGALPDAKQDVGPVIFPKLFRRQTSWWAYHEAGIEPGSFFTYLVKRRDALFLTSEFLRDGPNAAPPHFLSDFLQTGGRFTLQPDEMVFSEKPSHLIGPDGKLITRF